VVTAGLDQVIHAIRPGARPAGRKTFPRDLPEGSVRRSRSEPAHTWLRRCVDTHFAGDVTRVTVEENLALFLVVRWDGGTVSYANLQALWAEVALSVSLPEPARSPIGEATRALPPRDERTSRCASHARNLERSACERPPRTRRWRKDETVLGALAGNVRSRPRRRCRARGWRSRVEVATTHAFVPRAKRSSAA
jgi:hypothetical protein